MIDTTLSHPLSSLLFFIFVSHTLPYLFITFNYLLYLDKQKKTIRERNIFVYLYKANTIFVYLFILFYLFFSKPNNRDIKKKRKGNHITQTPPRILINKHKRKNKSKKPHPKPIKIEEAYTTHIGASILPPNRDVTRRSHKCLEVV